MYIYILLACRPFQPLVLGPSERGSDVAAQLVTPAVLPRLCHFGSFCAVFPRSHARLPLVQRGSSRPADCGIRASSSPLFFSFFTPPLPTPLSHPHRPPPSTLPCPCVCFCIRTCIYNPRPFTSATWIHPISWSPWLPRPLITEGSRQIKQVCILTTSPPTTMVARNLCST